MDQANHMQFNPWSVIVINSEFFDSSCVIRVTKVTLFQF